MRGHIAVVVVALCLPAGAGGCAGGNQVSPTVAHSVAWSPDGKLVAFVGSDGVYVVDPSGAGLRRVLEGAVEMPTWAPSRPELALVTQPDPKVGDGDITLVGLLQSGRRNLTRSAADDVDPAWSPDGQTVVFSSNRGGNYDLYRVDREGRNLRRLTRDPARDSAPVWSPDGRTIVFRREGGSRVPFSGGAESIVQIDADGAPERVLLTLNPADDLNRCCWRPRWLPDGRRVVVDLGASIRAIDVATGKARLLARRGTAPLPSPDGTRILFERWRPVDCSGKSGICIPYGFDGLWVVSADGTHEHSLKAFAYGDSSWSPDGRRVAFVLDVNGERSIAFADADGSGFRQLRL